VGNSTIRLQEIVDSVSTIGDLTPVLKNTGGFANEPAITIATDVMAQIIAERNPWKWNEFKIKPFVLTSSQQDYMTVGLRDLGWLTQAWRVDINNTQIPPPVWPLEVKRDLPVSVVAAAWPFKVCWKQNDILEQGVWPGPNMAYTDPIGQISTFPPNPPTNIAIEDGTLLTLIFYGTTGDTEPVVPPWEPPPDNPEMKQPEEYPIGLKITDGTCIWQVCDPNAQGFRMWPPPPQGGNAWLIRLIGQRKAPRVISMRQKLDPIPDDQINWFRDGFIAYAHRHSSNPQVKAKFEQMKNDWIASMVAQSFQNDREDENYSTYPDRPIMAGSYNYDPGPGNPYWRQWGGR
jgi:hypothetical protein